MFYSKKKNNDSYHHHQLLRQVKNLLNLCPLTKPVNRRQLYLSLVQWLLSLLLIALTVTLWCLSNQVLWFLPSWLPCACIIIVKFSFWGLVFKPHISIRVHHGRTFGLWLGWVLVYLLVWHLRWYLIWHHWSRLINQNNNYFSFKKTNNYKNNS